MSTVNVPTGDFFQIINGNTVRYNGTDYTGVTDIEAPDGTHKTPQEYIDEAGGTSFSSNELKVCVKVQGINPDENNREIFSVYSNNSHQTVKNTSAGVPGQQMSVELFNFLGDFTTNYIIKMWTDYFYPGNPAPPQPPFRPEWLGFRINYGITETRSYVMTQVNSMQEESVPCPAALIDVTWMHGVRLDGVFKQPAPVTPSSLGTDYYVPIGTFRLYRSQTLSDGTFDYRLVDISPFPIDPGAPVGVFPASTAFGANFWLNSYNFRFFDNIRNEDLSTVELESLDWDPPPRGLKGLQLLPNGSLAAFKENNVYFSEPFRPHAWPEKYIQTVGFEITALEQDGMGLIALTTGFAYALLGAHPSVVVPQRLDQTQSAKKANLLNNIQGPSHSVCKTPAGIVYATDEGLMLEAGGQTRMISANLFTKTDWQQRMRSSLGQLWLAYTNGKILGYTTGGEVNLNFLMALDGSWLTEFRPGRVIYTHFTLPGSDGLYVVSGDGTTASELRKFEDWRSGTMAATWLSKRMIFAKPYNFGCYQIAGQGPVTVSIYCDNAVAVVDDLILASGVAEIHRIPITERSRAWRVQLDMDEGGLVSEFYMANTQLELQQV